MKLFKTTLLCTALVLGLPSCGDDGDDAGTTGGTTAGETTAETTEGGTTEGETTEGGTTEGETTEGGTTEGETTEGGTTEGETTEGGTTEGGTTGEPPMATFCETYAATCDGVMTCGANGDEDCMLADCATWWAAAAEGTDADTAGATQGCYSYHLDVATADEDSAAIHCPHAKGDAVCVDAAPATFCESYAATCDGVMTCGANGDEDCMLADCATWWAAAAEGTDADTAGATQGCYNYHLDVAMTDADSAAIHCPHAKGDAICVDAAPATFCDTYAATCDGVMSCGANGDEDCMLADCATWWAAAAEGTDADTAGATQGCYNYHLDVATTDADSAVIHCPHAKGDAICVDAAPATFCETYAATCDGVMTCGANGDEDCMLADCATWWAAAAEGTDADTAGATQGCYNYHLGVATADEASAAIHCPHAKGDAICVDAQ